MSESYIDAPHTPEQAHGDSEIDYWSRGHSMAKRAADQTEMDPESGLKPCPFCGGRAKLKTGEECAIAQCLNMSAHRLIVDGDNDAANEVTQMWNMRPAPADGWKWVPVEPTEAMKEAGQGCNLLVGDDPMGDAYRAMIAAAPESGESNGS